MFNKNKAIDANIEEESKWKACRKIIFAFIILLIPIIIVIVLFTPFIYKKNAVPSKKSYKLKENFTIEDLHNFVDLMKKDPEFSGYFTAIPQMKISYAVNEIYPVLDKNRSKEALHTQLNKMKNKVEALAFGFSQLHYPGDFFENPKDYPDLCKALGAFIYEEFKVSVVGVYYKSKFDIKYKFNWDEYTLQAAKDWIKIMMVLKQKHDNDIEIFFE